MLSFRTKVSSVKKDKLQDKVCRSSGEKGQTRKQVSNSIWQFVQCMTLKWRTAACVEVEYKVKETIATRRRLGNSGRSNVTEVSIS